MKKLGVALILCLLLCSSFVAAEFFENFFEKFTEKTGASIFDILKGNKIKISKLPKKVGLKSDISLTQKNIMALDTAPRDLSKKQIYLSSFPVVNPYVHKDLAISNIEIQNIKPQENWKLMKSIQEPKLQFMKELLIHPHNNDYLLALSHGLNEEPWQSQIYSSNDGGETWGQSLGYANMIFLKESQNSIASPLSSIQIYAVSFGGEIKISTDFGETWEIITNLDSDISHMAFDINNPNKIYAFANTVLPTQPGVYISSDGGNTWSFHTYSLSLNPGEDWPIVWDSIQDADTGYLYIGIEFGQKPNNPSLYEPPILRSIDGGLTWDDISPRNTINKVPATNLEYCPNSLDSLYHTNHIHFMEIDQQNDILYFHEEGSKFFKSENNGNSYEFLSCYPYVFEMKLNNLNPNEIFFGESLFPSCDDVNYYPCCPNDYEPCARGRLWLTKNSGQSFELISDIGFNIVDLDYTNDYNSLYVSNYGQGIYKFSRVSEEATGKLSLNQDILNNKLPKKIDPTPPKIIKRKSWFSNLFTGRFFSIWQ